MIILGFTTIDFEPKPKINSNKTLIDENSYYEKGRKEMKELPCPTCKERNGLFIGNNYICCFNCMNYFGTQKEYILYWI